MKSPVADHRSAALAACDSTVPLLHEAGLNEVAEQLAEIASLAVAGDDEAAFSLARKLPQSDIADFWDPLDWDPDQLPLERKALITAHYLVAWRALVNWRVAKSCGFERKVVDVRASALEIAAQELLAQHRARHAPDA